MNEKRFYVYGHYTADTDELFYIGKGSKRRAWDRYGRNEYWKNKVKKHGLVVKILVDGLTEDDAYEKEKQLITEIGTGTLTNMTEGGEGISSNIAKQIATIRNANPEYRRRLLEANRLEAKRRAQDVQWQEEHRARVKKMWESQELREQQRRITQDLYTNPIYRQNVTQGARRRSSNPEYRKKLSEGCIKRSQNPEYLRKISEAGKRVANARPPAVREKLRRASIDANAKTYPGVISPDGTIYPTIHNLNQFCKTHQLNRWQMYQLLDEKITTHNGWRKYIK